MHRTLIALHEKHGKLVRTGPNEVSVADPGAIKIMYGAGTKFRKSDIYSVFQGHRKFDIFPERDEKIHGAQRKLVARAYAMDCMKDLEPYVNDAIRFFLNCMDQMKEESIDMGNWFQLFAFDVIGELTFSQSFGFMKNGQDDGTFKSIKDAIRSGAWVGQIPSLYWIHDRLMPYIGNHLSINIRNGSLRTFTANAVSARKARGSDRKDVLAKLFAVHEEKPAEFNYDAIVSMASSNVTAGSDTTAISLRGILYHLLRTPHCMERLVEEIDSFRAQGKISDPVSLNEADGMPYLQAVMYEGLRLHPAIGFTLPRVVPEGGVEIDGHSIPAGTVAGASAWVIHRNKEVYGEDAEAFRPERWLDGNVGDKKRFFFSFGGGARLCIGKNISWLEMSKLIPTLLMHYDVKLTDPTKEWEEDCCFFVLQTGFDVRLKPRMMQV
ncbi:MAG: hypothetical protein M1822_008160 [Bathelium mastoideum]|nr:MAG: hypothetical protein M1822_008160 [Bathelium mastoideum]